MILETAVIFKVLFWVCAGLVAYEYAGYPALLALLARFAPRPVSPAQTFEPSVSILISAYNESAVIREKLQNTLALKYPTSQREIIVISDCSDDGTDEIVAEFASLGVQLVRQNQRLGKSAGLNLAVPLARGDLLVFSDANALYEPYAVRHLARHFADPQVGYVVGNARYVKKLSEGPSAFAEGLYWKLETWLKRKESAFESVVGGDGAIYAIRRELYTPLLPTDINDFLNPLQIIDRGRLGVFEPAAISYEETAESFQKEYRRKVRIVSRSLNALRRVPGILNPFRHTRHWILLVSHKLLRWFVPYFLILLFIASVALWRSTFYRVAVSLQVAFYGMALVGWNLQRWHEPGKVFSVSFYFCLVNLASLLGSIKCFRGDLSGTWSPPRTKSPVKT